jgi:hypothetical protein
MNRPPMSDEAKRLQRFVTEKLRSYQADKHRDSRLMREAQRLLRSAMEADGISTRYRGRVAGS